MRLLGIDPGLNVTGYGVIDVSGTQPLLVEAGVVRSTAKASLTRRVGEIHDGVTEVIALHQPAAVAVEQLYSHYQRPRTAILMGHARGVICLAAAQAQLDVRSYAATQIKKILTGNGRASKLQMQQSIARELNLAAPPSPADVADALAAALCDHYLTKAQRQIA